MTVGIGVICEGGKAAVVAADRLSTSIEGVFEADHAKIRVISPRIVVACAGTGFEMTHVLSGLHDDSTLSLREFAERLRVSREAMKSLKVDHLVKQRLGISFGEFSQVVAKADGQVYAEVAREVKALQLGMNLLVVGLDEAGAHLWYVDDIAIPASFDDEGFIAIGSGGSHSSTVLARQEYRKSFGLPEAVLSVYTAKRAAEMNPHVGRKTDMVILESGREPRFLGKPVKRTVRAIYRKKLKAQRLNKQDRASLGELLK